MEVLMGLAVGFVMGWLVSEAVRLVISHSRSKDPVEKRVKYRILSITYRTDDKNAELGRFLWAKEFSDWGEAMAEAKKRTDEDTLKNQFNTEYTVVEAP